jgi:hypothetical protein
VTWYIEPLTEHKLDDFIEICKELLYAGEQQHLGFDDEVTRILGMNCIHQPTYFCQMAYLGNGRLVGCMAGYVTKLIFSNQHIGNEEGLYVREGTPERAAIAAEMLRRFVRFCMDCGAIDVRTGVISNIDNYAADVFYRRNGFKRIGTIYALRNTGDM